MKKTLFALLACATLAAPAMADNWKIDYADVTIYGDHNNKDDYTFYLYQAPTMSVASVTNAIANMTTSEFNSVAGTGYSFTRSGSYDGMIRTDSSLTTTLSKDSTPANSVFGVCVYNGEDAAFTVVESNVQWANVFGKLLYFNKNTTYTSFKDTPVMWNVDYADVTIYGNHTNKDDYTFYLYRAADTDIASVTSTIANMTPSEFAAQAGEGYDFTRSGSYEGMIRTDANFATTLPKDSNPADSIWGVCVYNDGEDAAFTVVESNVAWAAAYDKLLYFNKNTTYTSFNSGAVPEPATATLSLMALAGLASRRRRK